MSSTISTDLSQPKLTLLANSLDTVISKPALYRLLTFQVPNLISPFRCLGRTKISIQARGMYSNFVTKPVFMARICQHLAQPPSCRTNPCRLSATAYSIYSQLTSILEAVPPTAGGTRWRSWLRHCATSRKVAGSIPDGVIGFLH